MHSLSASFSTALDLVLRADPKLSSIVALSLQVSMSAVAVAALIALPLGATVSRAADRSRCCSTP
jgi:tungstate transport system permease protein